jgi:hypothetical protein
MSSSLACVASLRLIRSVALSLLRRLSKDISFCKAVAMFVKVIICSERLSPAVCDFTMAVELFVTVAKGFGDSEAGDSLDDTEGIFCNASIVADCGGVFSIRMLWWGRRAEGRTTGVELIGVCVGVPGTFSLSADFSLSFSRPRTGVEGRVNFSSGLGELIESRRRESSSIKLMSFTLEGCKDCMRLCGLPLATSALSGEVSVMRFVSTGIRAFSRAFSVSAAWADCMAAEVPVRDGPTPGDCGFNGRGGGALSGSELSHLRFVSFENDGMAWHGMACLGRLEDDAEGGKRANLHWDQCPTLVDGGGMGMSKMQVCGSISLDGRHLGRICLYAMEWSGR